MSEMSAEKKKEIEKYIIKSYFGGGKNVESLANGADVVKGTDDGYIPQLIVEVTYFGESGIVMIKWNIYGDSQQNSFAMRVCREREIERNRCDSVDAMAYAWESWRSKIQGKPIFIGKDKKCIEFSMRSMMVTHKPYEDHSDISITGMIPDREIFAANNPFDIPCDVVMVSKRDFEKMQTENEQLKKKLNKLDPMPEFKELLKKLYSTDDVEKLAWTLNHICGCRGSVNGWIAVSSFWKQNYETLSKLVGFSSVEEIKDYLTNEAECDTLHEAILKLIDENKYVCEEWCKANSSNNSWKAAAECNSPKELIEKLNLLHNDIAGRIDVIKTYSRALKEWKEITCCPSPSAAKTAIECGESWHHEYDDAKKEIKEWKEATGCTSPRQAIIRIRGLENAIRRADRNMLKELDSEIDEWQKATGCDSPEEAKEKLGGFIQAASCAEKHLEHILLWRPEQTGQEVE